MSSSYTPREDLPTTLQDLIDFMQSNYDGVPLNCVEVLMPDPNGCAYELVLEDEVMIQDGDTKVLQLLLAITGMLRVIDYDNAASSKH